MTEPKEGEVLIVGAGPAGLSTALQLKRYGVEAFLFEKEEPGGLLRNANLVENYLGFPDGIPGPELVQLFKRQAVQAGVSILRSEVMQLDEAGGWFTAAASTGCYRARLAVIATGTKPRRLPYAPAASERVLYEVWPVKGASGKRFAIVGAGDLAFDFALNLGDKNHVTLLNRGEETRCLPLLKDWAWARSQVEYRARTQVLHIHEDSRGLQLECVGPEGMFTLAVDYLIGAIGREPALDAVSPGLLREAPVLEQAGRLYWAGDVKNGMCRQAAIAAGDGIGTAMKIERFLKGCSHESQRGNRL